ncbi:alpha/beta hydrolase fold domain-containing protein [Actinomycetospora sp. CA-101289]|uniref:alpha/beta hydrolase fold domain-containing protein n=1 Tax=Actinomycetospora sp. CA-101289 TaxID=3239893 RepID=UPI003D984DA5
MTPPLPPSPAPMPAPVRVDGVDVLRAVEYRVVPGYRPLLLDLHRPDTVPSPPLVVFVHGGGWRMGSRGTFGPSFADWSPSPFAHLAARGLAVASLDYRLSGEAVFPAALDDVVDGLCWLREHAGELGVDASRVVLWGESAGAHLAALAGLLDGDVRGVVDWYGPADLGTMAADAAAGGIAITDPGAPDSRESLLLGAPVGDDPDRARAASPVAHVRAGAPPFLVLHGTADRFVPARQSERLVAALESVGAPVRCELVDGADHLWLGAPDVARSAFETSAAFASECLTP